MKQTALERIREQRKKSEDEKVIAAFLFAEQAILEEQGIAVSNKGTKQEQNLRNSEGFFKGFTGKMGEWLK